MGWEQGWSEGRGTMVLPLSRRLVGSSGREKCREQGIEKMKKFLDFIYKYTDVWLRNGGKMEIQTPKDRGPTPNLGVGGRRSYAVLRFVIRIHRGGKEKNTMEAGVVFVVQGGRLGRFTLLSLGAIMRKSVSNKGPKQERG